MAGDRTLKVTILGDDRSGSRALKGIGDSADQAGAKIDSFGEKWGPRLTVAGAAVGVFGAKLTQMGDESKQATAQLTTAIENAGGSMDRFGPKIAAVSEKMINLGHDDEAAARAMATLATATQDPTKAIESMGLVADIAAARHISLESAADKLAKGYAGNTKVFKEFGITLAANATDAEKAAAMTELQARVSGQAAAQADNLTTKLTALRTRVENVAESVGSTLGPILTVAGTAMAGLGGLSQATGMSLGQLGAKLAATGPLVAIFAATIGGIVYGLSQAPSQLKIMGDDLVRFTRLTTDEMVSEWSRMAESQFISVKQMEQGFRSLAEGSFGSAQRMIAGLEAQSNKTKEQEAQLARYKAILDEVGAANIRAGEDAGVHAEAEADLTSALEDAKAAADGLKQELDALLGVHVSAIQETVNHESKARALQAAITDGTASLDRHTDAGARTTLQLLDLITSTGSVAQSMIAEGASADEATAALQANVGQIDSMVASLGPLPPDIQRVINRLRDLAALPNITKTIDIFTRYSTIGSAVGSAIRGIQQFASGIEMGPVKGRRGEAVPVLAHGGEWVVTPAQMEALRGSGRGAGPVTTTGRGAEAEAFTGAPTVLQLVLNTGELIGSVVLPGLLQLQARQDLGIKAS